MNKLILQPRKYKSYNKVIFHTHLTFTLTPDAGAQLQGLSDRNHSFISPFKNYSCNSSAIPKPHFSTQILKLKLELLE